MSAKITWYILENGSYNNYNDYYYGDIDASTETIISIQMWNNRYGTVAVDDLYNCKLSLQTLNIDDAYVLDYIQVQINNDLYADPILVDETKRYVLISPVISGAANDGVYNSQALLNKQNVVNIKIKMSGISYKINESLKHLILNLEYQ